MIYSRTIRIGITLATCFTLAGALSAEAKAQVLVDTGRGWLNNSGGVNGNDASNNYITGTYPAGSGARYRNHFDFGIPTLSGTLAGATLVLHQPILAVEGGDGHGGGTTTYSVSSLGGFGSYVFADIGAGTPYGNVSLTSASDGTNVSIVLNAAALADITADQGATFSLGGKNSGESIDFPGFDFAFSNIDNVTDFSHLNLVTRQTSSGTPEPGSIALALGLLGTGVLAVRRRR